QLDWTDEDVRDPDLWGEVSGSGWMVGPYVGIRLTERFFFNARAAWGQLDSDIELTDDLHGFRSGDFETDRWLVSGELVGNWHRGALRISPSIEVSYGSADQEAYKNSHGVEIGANEITIGRSTFGVELGYQRYIPETGTIIEPHISIEGLWNFSTDDTKLSDGTPLHDDDFRARVEGGFIFRKDNGINVRITGQYDGIGDSDFESYGGKAWVNIPLN
ncbi:MAG: autotransporter outer membrane beta-barrel domain-containing protein, partial [Rhizobiaceae bacterium]